MLSCFSEKKWNNFNSTHRRIHLHKASPISYNPPPKSTSDLTSAFYLCRLRSGAALWTWQIAYWSADVVVNVLSTWAAAAVACSLQPVLSPEHLQLSPLPPSLLPHYNSPLPSCYEGAPPPLSVLPHTAFQPPSSSLLVLQGVERVTDKRHLLQQAENGRWDQLWAMWPLTLASYGHWKQGQGKICGKTKNPSSAHWQINSGKVEMERGKKTNLHCFNPQGRLHSHGALTQQLVKKRSCKLTPRPSCFLVLQSIHMFPTTTCLSLSNDFNKLFFLNTSNLPWLNCVSAAYQGHH